MPHPSSAAATAPTMRALVGDTLESLSGYRLATLPRPDPGPGQVRLRVGAASLGWVDALLAVGRYQVKPTLPFVPACEFAGVVDAVGDGVDAAWLGRRAAAQAFGGGLAEWALAPAHSLQPTPDNVDDAGAAAFWLDHATAWHALRDRARLQPGETVLVMGAAGSVGLAAVQQARHLGARVIATASSAAKREATLAAGAHEAVDYTADGWTDQIEALTHGRGVDVVFDPVGGASFEPAFRRLAWGGRHLVVGFAGGPIPALPINLALLKGASLVGVDIRQFAQVFEGERARAERDELQALLRDGALRPRIGARFAFDQAGAALAACHDRTRIGKTVVTLG